MFWALGDYRLTAAFIEPDAQALAERSALRQGMEVLDVAAGNGNFALAAARKGARVIATDLTPRMVEWGRARSANDGLDIEWHEADAEALPFGDGSFEVVASTFGAQFAPRPEVVAGEMFRVLKPGGLVAMTNWTAEGFSGRLTALVTGYAPPSPLKLPSPMEWGDPDEVRRRLGPYTASIETECRTAKFTLASVEAAQEFFEQTNPALLVLSRMLPEPRYAELRTAAHSLVSAFCKPSGPGVLLENGYLVVLARKS
jgi:SAM-dependent methyltransferase